MPCSIDLSSKSLLILDCIRLSMFGSRTALKGFVRLRCILSILWWIHIKILFGSAEGPNNLFVFESQVDSSLGKNSCNNWQTFYCQKNQWLGRGIGGLQIHLLLWKDLRRFDFHLIVAGRFFDLMQPLGEFQVQIVASAAQKCYRVNPSGQDGWHGIFGYSWWTDITLMWYERSRICFHICGNCRPPDPRSIGIQPIALQDDDCPLDEVSSIPRFRMKKQSMSQSAVCISSNFTQI